VDGVNIAHLAVDRHAAGPSADQDAVRFVDRAGGVTALTYGELARETNRFANLLRTLGVRDGESVFTLTARLPVLHTAVLGTLKAGAVSCPLSPMFGPEPVRERLVRGDAVVLVTTAPLLRRTVARVLDAVPSLRHVLVAGDWEGRGVGGPRVTEISGALAAEPDTFTIGPTSAEDPALLHFTSGTTGPPKAAVHVHGAAAAHQASAELVFGLGPGDVFWCTAEPGWVTGTSYGIIAPLACRATSVVDMCEFDASRWYAVLEQQRVNVWYTSPTAIRMLMRAGDDLAHQFDLSSLRCIASVGEPLAPECVHWGERALGRPVRDTWWQTETGAIMIGNPPSSRLKPGSMGRPLPGITAAVLRCGDDGRAQVRDASASPAAPGEEGELALRPGWPSMFRAYLHDEAAYRACFVGGWYLTGDIARQDGDGYFWFVGRADDMIKSAGHFVGPFEVERVLTAHPAVAEAAAVGAPDPVAGEVVTAFVTLRDGYSPSDELRRELIAWGRTRLGAAVAPRRITFDDRLPHTTSGKIVRRSLRERQASR